MALYIRLEWLFFLCLLLLIRLVFFAVNDWLYGSYNHGDSYRKSSIIRKSSIQMLVKETGARILCHLVDMSEFSIAGQ